MESSSTIQTYLKHCEEDLLHSSIGQYLSQLAMEKGLSKSEIFKHAEINDIYGYQIFSDTRMPSRDKLICLIIGMQLDSTKAATVLKYAGYAPLYPRNRRDSIILYGIINKADILTINEWLYDESEATLT